MLYRVSPTQLREIISEVRTNQLRVQHQLEYYEAIIQTAPSYLRPQMQAELDDLLAMNRVANDNVRSYAEALEQILMDDEAENGWKGKDRYIEL